MKKIIALFLVCYLATQANAQVKVPPPSPPATVTTVIGLSDVKVEYSRPKAKGRKIFGNGNEYVVPFGALWRTAANDGSKITFTEDVKFGNTDVPKGTYLLLSIPDATNWTIILYKDVAMGGNTDTYDIAKDQARVIIKPEKLTEKVETFTIEIADLSENGRTANLQLIWENTSIKIPISVDIDAKVMRSIELNTKVLPNNLVVAATYYLENGKDLNQALLWINSALESSPNAFWMLYHKARILKALNNISGAMIISKASWEESKKAGREDFQRMNEELQKSLK